MSLPAPNLDDRRFQDLVDEAKRYVQRRCPEWTDHNVSDPGVTLIETFASMVDQLTYRLNRVPDRHYLKFLELIGVRLFPPTPARVDLTFWLSAARPEPVAVAARTQVATVRIESEEPIVFATTRELTIVPCSLQTLMVASAEQRAADRTAELASQSGVSCFQDTPAAGDMVLFGLGDPVPGCAVLLRLECEVHGIGVDPNNPPLVWEAWDGADWARCAVERDATGGLNRSGDLVVHLPSTHAPMVVEGVRAGWLRCRVIVPAAHQAFYQKSPRIMRVEASTIGGTVGSVHAENVLEEVLGVSEGLPGQRFELGRTPVVSEDEPLVVEVSAEAGWEPWTEVSSFAESGRDDRHVSIDRAAGEVHFGPAVRQPDGTLRHYGAVPALGAQIRIPAYRIGGGRRGNVARDTLVILRDPVPFVSTVTNRRPAGGGTDGESVADAATRGPLQLRTRERAVTAEDYEQLAREAAPQALRVRCVPAAGEDQGIRVLIVPAVAEVDGRLRFADLKPSDELLAQVAAYLDERRCVGARVIVEPPFYQGVTVVAQLKPRPHVATAAVQQRALAALDRYLSPIGGGPDGRGWPFGRPIQSGEIFAVLQRVSGVDMVEDIRLFAANPRTGERGDSLQRIDLPPHGLVFSYEHQIRTVP
jgi:predicted phage baseplate assembly protein